MATSPSLRQLPHVHLTDRSAELLLIRERLARPPIPRLATQRDDSSREALRCRVRGEFEEMPRMTLTLPQAQRLFGMREDVCARVVNELMRQGFLARMTDGQVCRCDGA